VQELLVIFTCLATGFWWVYLVFTSDSRPISKLSKILDITLDTLIALWALSLPILATVALKNVFLGFALGAGIMAFQYWMLKARLKNEGLEGLGSPKAAIRPVSYLAAVATILLETSLFFFFTAGNPSLELSWLVGGSVVLLDFMILYRHLRKR
jgi:hypothetical protein